MPKRVLVGVVLICSLALSMPALVGLQVESYYGRLLQRLQAQGVVIDEQQYRRGWFSSRAQSRLKLPLILAADEGAPRPGVLVVRLDSDIAHGPFPFWSLSRGQLQPLQASIVTRVGFEGGPWPAKELPLRVRTRIELNGDAEARVQLPPPQPEAQPGAGGWEFSGIDGWVRFDREFTSVRTQLDLGELRLLSPHQPQLDLTALQIRSQAAAGAAGVMLGDGEITLESFALRDRQGGVSVVGGGIAVGASSAAGEGGLVNTSFHYDIDRLQIDGANYAPSGLSISVERLSAVVLGAIHRALREYSSQQLPQAQRALAVATVLMAQLPRLLSSNPRLSIDRVHITTPEGPIEGRMVLQPRELGAAQLSDPGKLLERLYAELQLQLPERLLRKLLAARLAAARESDSAGAVAAPSSEGARAGESTAAAERQIERLVRQELLVRTGDVLAIAASLTDGLLTVNGKTIPLTATQPGF